MSSTSSMAEDADMVGILQRFGKHLPRPPPPRDQARVRCLLWVMNISQLDVHLHYVLQRSQRGGGPSSELGATELGVGSNRARSWE